MFVNTWSRLGGNRSYLASIVEDCLLFSRYFDALQLLHVRRTTKLAAGFMARYDLAYPCNVWIEEYPSGLDGILVSDVGALQKD